MIIKSAQEILTLSCILKSCFGYTNCYLPFTVNRDLSLSLKTKTLSKGFKDIMKNMPDIVRQMNIEINQTCSCYNQRENIVQKQGSVFFELGIRCSAVLAFKKAARHICSASPAKFGIVSHVENTIKKISDMSMVKETDIEKHIASAVVALNKVKDFCTVYSCHGHRFGFPVMRPFVSFISKNTETVMEFARKLYQEQFQYRWYISGTAINLCPIYHPYIMWSLNMGNIFFIRKKFKADIEKIEKCLTTL